MPAYNAPSLLQTQILLRVLFNRLHRKRASTGPFDAKYFVTNKTG